MHATATAAALAICLVGENEKNIGLSRGNNIQISFEGFLQALTDKDLAYRMRRNLSQ